ncbi:lipoate--protein ligase family protein [Oceanimonas baumannii]|nr:lipoate--protein ligase family protein [Oceanimonas baumannii]TDW55261.1 lipoate-protein ligase A [Oceanimonas baumannii]
MSQPKPDDLPNGLPPLLLPEQGLAREQQLLDRVVRNERGYGFLLWRSRRGLVVPTASSRLPGFELAGQRLARRGWPLVLRQTGGDLTVQSPHLLNVAMVFILNPVPGAIGQAYQRFCQPLLAALADMGIDAYCGAVPGAFCDGDYNLVVDGRKLAGTAQRWRKVKGLEAQAVLAHAAILCDEDEGELCRLTNDFYRYCRQPRRVREDRHVTVSRLMGLKPGHSAMALLSRTLYQRLGQASDFMEEQDEG